MEEKLQLYHVTAMYVLREVDPKYTYMQWESPKISRVCVCDRWMSGLYTAGRGPSFLFICTSCLLARTRIMGCLAKARPLPTNLSPVEQKAIRSLKQAEDIIIAPADKENATVVTDCTTYDGKIRTLLADARAAERATLTLHSKRRLHPRFSLLPVEGSL